MIELAIIVVFAIACAVGGFWLSHHIHQVANAAARAVTPPAGVVAALPTPLGTFVTDASKAAQAAVADAASKVS